MSKFLKEDSREHHYEKEMHENHMKQLNRINTFRQFANEYKSAIEIKYTADILSHDDFGNAMHYYAEIIKMTNACLIMLENKMISKDYEKFIVLVGNYSCRLEHFAKD